MRKLNIIGSVRLALSILFYVTVFVLPLNVEAKAKIVAIEGINYNVNSSLEDNLKSLIGKKVSVTLDSGKTITGLVKEVGNHLVHLEKIEGKEYFDALIRIETISAVDTRFRDALR